MASTCWLDVVASLSGFASVCLLSVPAIHVMRYAYLASRISVKRVQMEGELREIADQNAKDLEALRDRWVFWKFLCLVFGTIAAGLAPLFSLAGVAFC
jgi:hypothetical protein